MVDLIKPFTFVTINHNELEEEHGVKEGDLLFVAAAQAFPISEDDPYTQRIFIFVQKTIDGMIDDESGIYVIDPKSVNNVSQEEFDRLALLNMPVEDATIN